MHGAYIETTGDDISSVRKLRMQITQAAIAIVQFDIDGGCGVEWLLSEIDFGSMSIARDRNGKGNDRSPCVIDQLEGMHRLRPGGK
jgi:hypothetical protein